MVAEIVNGQSYVDGIKVGSINEYNVALVFDALKYPYQYQYPIMGGSSIRGGRKLDFLVDLAPLPIPVLVQGAHWHSDPTVEEFTAIVISEYGKGYWDEMVPLMEAETMTFDSTYDAVKRKIR
jgi:hypothetical protein